MQEIILPSPIITKMTARDRDPKTNSSGGPLTSIVCPPVAMPLPKDQDENANQSISKGGMTTPFPWKLDMADPAVAVPLSREQDEDTDQSIAKGGVTTPFPWKLHDMLDDMAETGDTSVVCWQPHGRAFMVHKPQDFVTEIMRKYFNQTKYASFQRQLNLYGFSRLSHGKDKGAYYHHCFVRGQRTLCRNMVRQKIKGTKVRRSLSAEEEPNFYAPKYQIPSTPSPALPTIVAVRTENPAKSSARAPRSPSKSRSKKTKVPPQVLPPTSLVSMMSQTKSAGRNAHLPLITSAQMIKPRQSPRIQAHPSHAGIYSQAITSTGTVPTARGGDLLFFEGRPFRYLEHIEELPPPAPQSRPLHSTLHDMITSIVSMERKSRWATQNGKGLIQSN